MTFSVGCLENSDIEPENVDPKKLHADLRPSVCLENSDKTETLWGENVFKKLNV